MGNLCQRADIRHYTKIIRRGDIDRTDLFAFLKQSIQLFFHLLWVQPTNQPFLLGPGRVDPFRLQSQQRHRIDRRRMDIASCHDFPVRSRHHPQHRLDAKGRTTRTDDRRAGTVQLGKDFLQFLERSIVLE